MDGKYVNPDCVEGVGFEYLVCVINNYSYRKLAMRWHPKNFTADERRQAEAKFRQITEAFEVLSNSEFK